MMLLPPPTFAMVPSLTSSPTVRPETGLPW